MYPDKTDLGYETPYKEFLKYRFLYKRALVKKDLGFMARCVKDPVFAIQACFEIENPKDFIHKGIRMLPFRLYKYQADFIRHLDKCYFRGDDLIVRKSRETGFSWLVVAYGVYRWLFFKNENIIYLTLKKEALYVKNSSGTLFGKVEQIINGLNNKICLVERKDKTGAQFKNSLNGSLIRGIGGDSGGRSDRCSLLFADEMAYWDKPDTILGSLTSVSSCKCYGSTLNARGDAFDRKCDDLRDTLFEFNWRDDPRKDEEWRKKETKKIGVDKFNLEYDMKYNEVSRNPLVKDSWFTSAISLKNSNTVSFRQDHHAGFDLAASGTNYCALCIRNGCEILHLSKWKEDDIRESIRIVFDICSKFRCNRVNYDATGMGNAARYCYDQVCKEYRIRPSFNPIVMSQGCPNVMYAGRTSSSQFLNFRAYWHTVVRDLFIRSFRKSTYSEDVGDNYIRFSGSISDEIISELRTQSNQVEVTNSNTGKIQIESKVNMHKRGVASPDILDSLILSFIGFSNFEYTYSEVYSSRNIAKAIGS